VKGAPAQEQENEMKNRSGQREPVDIPRERHEGWGDEDATPTPEEEAHRRQLLEEMTPGSPIQSDRQRYAIRDAGVASSDVVDNTDEQ
jgi:hypothetical protein